MLPNGRRHAPRQLRLIARSALRELTRRIASPVPGYLGTRALVFVLGSVAFLAETFAQTPARPQFDVASIKPSEQRGMMYVRTAPGGRLLVNAPARLMLMNAYGL